MVCACVCLMFSPSFLLGTLLPLYVYIRTSTEVPISEIPQRLADTILHSTMRFSCGKACSLVVVETRLMVRPWTYECRRKDEVLYLEGKRKRTSSSFLLGKLLTIYVYIRTSTDVQLSELPQLLADTLFNRKSSFCCAEWCPLIAVESRLMVHSWTYVCRRIEEVV